MQKPRLIKKIAQRPSFYTQHSERALYRNITKRHEKVRAKNYPLIACVPSDILGRWIVFNGLYEEELLISLFEKVFNHSDLQRFKQTTVIDGGANVGNHSLFFSRYFKQVISFEPNPNALKLLDTNIFLNKTKNIQVIPVGLSNETKILPFFDNKISLGASAFIAENPLFEQQEPSQHLNVEKGDMLLEQHILEHESITISLIKLDVEWYELKALQGLEKTILKHQPIILFEANNSEGETGSKAVFNFLRQHNYAYFYTIEQKKRHPFFLIRFIEKLKGYEIVLNQIQEPEDRRYPLIIAMTTELKF
ncbi:MAG: FkbM family methyltransferase [Rickettsiella sp.]|nr:FkbM family methyltransferase [Rickettsiella sp.]